MLSYEKKARPTVEPGGGSGGVQRLLLLLEDDFFSLLGAVRFPLCAARARSLCAVLFLLDALAPLLPACERLMEPPVDLDVRAIDHSFARLRAPAEPTAHIRL
jgi:hypothetical protein